jgi:hypothetical protein
VSATRILCYRYGYLHLKQNLCLLGMCSGTASTISAFYGPGTGPIVLNLVACTGMERRLVDCPSGSLGGCSHSADAGVRCMQQTGIL